MAKLRNPGRMPILPIVLAAAGLLLGGGLLLGAERLGALRGPPAFHGTAWEPSETAADFHLTDHTGNPSSLGDHRGQAVLLFFGYTTCPDVCPLTLARLDRILSGMGEEARQVRVLLVTVDPARDTPEVLAGYVSRFGPWVTGLTGDAAALERVRKSYYVYAEPAPPPPAVLAEAHGDHAALGADLNHTPQVFGIDRKGEIRVLLPMERSEEEVEEDIRALLRF